MFGSRRARAEVQARLNGALNAALAEQTVRKRLSEMGVVPVGGSADCCRGRSRRNRAPAPDRPPTRSCSSEKSATVRARGCWRPDRGVAPADDLPPKSGKRRSLIRQKNGQSAWHSTCDTKGNQAHSESDTPPTKARAKREKV